MKIFIRIVAFLIIIPAYYLTYIFLKLVLTIIRIIVVIIENSINQVYTYNCNTNYCTTQPLVIAMASTSLKIPTKKLDTYSWQDGELTFD